MIQSTGIIQTNIVKQILGRTEIEGNSSSLGKDQYGIDNTIGIIGVWQDWINDLVSFIC